MHGSRFDDLARSLTANRTRRQALTGALALTLGGLAGRPAAPVSAALSKKRIRCAYPTDPAEQTNFDISGRHAQTFEATETGKLSEVTVWVNHRSEAGGFAGDYVAQIVRTDAAGAPVATAVLAEKVFSEDGLLTTEQPITFRFGGGTAAEVRQGRRYAVIIGRSGGRFAQVHRRIPDGDPCPGSDLYQNTSPTGGTFLKVDSIDMVFRTVIKYRR